MRRLLVLVSLLLCGVATSCVSQGDLQALRADLTVLERERRQRDQEINERLGTLTTRLTLPEQGQADLRRELAQTVATNDELRVEVQKLRGSLQELQHRTQQGMGLDARDVFATKLAELETRLAALEYRVDPTGSLALRPPETRPPPGSPPPSDAPATPESPAPAPATRPVIPAQPGVLPQPELPPDDAQDRLYKRALQEYQDGNHEVAIVLFKQFLRQYPQAPLTGHAQYWIGESLYAQKQYEAAIVAFDEVVQKHPDDAKVPAAILKQGFAFSALKDTRNARFFLQQVQKKYPDSPEAQQATEKLQQLK
jgi:tol-pal system protein YbgF